MKAIFCGTPEIAVPALSALAEISEIVGVVCQPDRPAGRGMKMRAPAVKERALSMGLSVFQPLKVRDGTLSTWMREKNADFALVIAYGRILTAETLGAPRLGCLNLHASLLPEYRGAAPIQRALMDGKAETGVCLMKMDEGMDTGDVLACHKLPILPEDNAGSLAERLGALAAHVTRLEIPRYVRGELTAVPQEQEQATYAPPLTHEDAEVHMGRSAQEIANRVRGLSPRPGAATRVMRGSDKPRRLKILEARVSEISMNLPPGQVMWMSGRFLVGTGSGILEIVKAQPEGKKAQSPADLHNGRALVDGDLLGVGHDERSGD